MEGGRKSDTTKKGTKGKARSTRALPLSTVEIARLCANVAVAHKAEEPVILNVAEMASFTDYFVILSGRSTRHVQAVAEHIEEALREHHLKLMGAEGLAEGQWVLLDAGDVIVHIFYHPVRAFYDLESLWAEARQVDLTGTTRKRRKPTRPDAGP
jgi:ribosome-associated protein